MNAKNPSGVFHKVHDIRVEERDSPTITNDSVIIQVEMTGVCGTDLHIYHEGLVPPGSVIGHEFCGQIVEKGDDVKDLNVGDRVVVNPMHNGVGLGLSPGGFARYVRIDQARKDVNIFTIPESINSEKGSLIEPLTVCLSAINNTDFKPTDNVLVTGCGTIGLSTISALKSKGVTNIVASDISERRLELAKKMGAKYTFNPKTDGDLKVFLENEFGTVPSLNYAGDLPNLNTAFECSGISPILQQVADMMAPDGNLTVIAIYSQEMTLDPNTIVYKRLKIVGSLFYANEDFQEAIDLVSSGKVDLTPIVSHQFPLDQLTKAFEVQADSSQSVKVIVSSI